MHTPAHPDVFQIARVAHHLQFAGDAPAVHVTRVQPVLLDDVALEPVQVLVGEQLAGKEARSAQALQAAGGRADRQVVGAGIEALGRRGLLRMRPGATAGRSE